MVLKASEDFPEPETQVITVILFFGILTDTFLRLCVLAHETSRNSDIKRLKIVNLIYCKKKNEHAKLFLNSLL